MGLCHGKEYKKNKQMFEKEIEISYSTMDHKSETNEFNCSISSSKEPCDNFNIVMDNSGLSHIVDCIFWYLDDKSQLKCRLVCRSWKEYIGRVLCSDYFK